MFFSRLQSEVQSATTVSSARQNSSQWYLKFPELLSFADHCVVCKAKLVSVLPLLFPLHLTKYMKPLKCVFRGSLIRMGHLIRGWHHHRNMRPPVITARRCGELARELSSRPAVAFYHPKCPGDLIFCTNICKILLPPNPQLHILFWLICQICSGIFVICIKKKVYSLAGIHLLKSDIQY